MLNRKGHKASAAKSHRHHPEPAAKARPVRHRFIISSKSALQSRARMEENRNGNGHAKAGNGHAKAAHSNSKAAVPAKNPAQGEQNPSFLLQTSADLTETIKTLLHLQQ